MTADIMDAMHLTIYIPSGLFTDVQASRLSARDRGGSFGVLPHHIDFVTALVPGLFSFTDDHGSEQFLGVDNGVLVKTGLDVRVSTRNAVSGPGLGDLKRRVQEQIASLDEDERRARTALARMESDFVRQFLKVKDHA